MMNFCQSCGMPMGDTNEMYGTEEDGSISKLYCKYCYVNGKFTMECNMDQMIEFCVPHMIEGNPDMTEEKARAMMREYMPMLKRWQ